MAIYNKEITATVEASSDKLNSGTGARAITTIIVCNTGATARDLTLYAIPNPGTDASSANMIVNALSIPAYDTVSFDQEKMVLAEFDEIRAICSGVGLTATVSTLPV